MLWFLATPFAIYVIAYFLLTFPLVLSFNTQYFCDKGDGLQTIWDLWWVRTAVTQLHQSPWFTNYLYAPNGITLWLHSLSPINGLVGIPLATFLSPVQTYNTIITLTFALSGVTMFWLANDVTRRYWPSIAAGYAFTFSAIRFAHAPGHLHQISTEFLPLFVMFWLRLKKRGTIRDAIGASAALFFLLLSDHYMFLYAVMIAVLIPSPLYAGERVRVRGSSNFSRFSKTKTPSPNLSPEYGGEESRYWTRRRVIAFATFAIITAATSLPIVLLISHANHINAPLLGAHDPADFSADLFGPFLPDYTWLYHSLTRLVWQPVGSVNETSVCIGPIVLIVGLYGAIKRKQWGWLILAIAFTLFAFGPALTILGNPVFRWMPYRLLEFILPPLRVSGCPGRMMIVTQLSMSVLFAVGLSTLLPLAASRAGAAELSERHLAKPQAAEELSTRRTLLATAITLLLVIESLPRLQPTLPPDVPKWCEALRDLPQPGAAIDLIDLGDERSEYHQTIHHRPIAQGYVSRVPVVLSEQGVAIIALARDGHFDELSKMGFRYIIAVPDERFDLPIRFTDRTATLYEIPKP